MISPQTAENLLKRLPDTTGEIRLFADMHPYVWFASAGVAEILFTPKDKSDLQHFLETLDKDIPIYALGGGSNMLIRGGGIAGVVISLRGAAFTKIDFDGEIFRAGAGVRDMELARAARTYQRTGLEFYIGIPGTVGGAVVMNAGAGGTETAQRLVAIKILDRNGVFSDLSADQIDFGYRFSNLAEDMIIIEGVFSSQPGKSDEIKEKMSAMIKHRGEAQPQGVRTGGSTFKNPPGHKAWALIDAAGCRGLERRGAKMSLKHCNFMINNGKASPDHLEELGEIVRERVYHHSGIMLEWEIKRIGIQQGVQQGVQNE